MKKVLVITYYWPPTGGSGVQRWVKFSKYLPQYGWQPVIYTPENPEMTSVDRSLEGDIPPEAIVVKRPITEFYSLYRRLMGRRDGSVKEVNPINNRERTFKQKLMLMLRGNLFIPDPRVTWVRPSVRFLKKYLEENPVDVIVSTGPPHSMHLIAMKVAAATGIPWIADFRDPWTKMFYFKHLGLCSWAEKKHHELERRVLDGATRVVAVSPLVKEDFEKMTGTPVELITNGFDESDFSEEIVPDGFFNITHTGLFAADGNPETLWKVLADKCAEDSSFRDALRLRLVGKTDSAITESIRQAGLGDNLVDLGYRDHRTAVREQKNASLLILPLRKEPEYRAVLPGKLFEYLASRRPILGIGQTDGAMARIIGNTGSGVVYDWDQESKIRACIDFCWDEFRQGELDDNSSDISEYTRRGLTHRYASLLDEITTEKNNHK